MISDDGAAAAYAHATVFLLQILLAKQALEAARRRGWEVFQADARAAARRAAARRASAGRGAAAATAAAAPLVFTTAADFFVGRAEVPLPSAPPKYTLGRSSSGSGGAGGNGGAAALLGEADERGVQQEMFNFVHNLHQFVVDRLLLNAWVNMQRVRGRACRWDGR
eukprot:364561-Chlamydomonas_euryale.AAC.5